MAGPPLRKSVAVIGAGPSGLCATKELVQEGHDVICLEREAEIGGLFRFSEDPDKIGVWRSCRLTSSALVTSFSDHRPWGEADPPQHRHWGHAEYVAYLKAYVDEFGLAGRIRLGCEVTAVEPGGDRAWRVSYRGPEGGATETLEVDAVAVCSGLHRKPHIPDLPGLGDFRGRVLHSAYYKDCDGLDARRAVFIGAGESGGEVIDEMSRRFERSYVSLRRGVFVIPRLLNGLPNDYTGTRLLYSLPESVVRRSDPEARSRLKRLSAILFPLAILRTALLGAQRRLKRRRRSNAQTKVQAALSAATRARDRRTEALILQLRDASGGNQFESFATKTEGFVNAMVEGRAELRPGIRVVVRDGVIFEDGSRVEADALVFCTGFEPASAPFLSAEVDLSRLYLNCYSPAVGETLAFIGFLRPPLGAIPPMAEMQARLFARVASGRQKLPPRSAMEADIERRIGKRRAYFRQVFDRLPQLVDYSTYMDELAELIGCKPRARDLLLRPRLLFKLYTAPFCAAQYRLRGPHARPRAAERMLLSAPSHFMAVRFVDLALSRLASACGWEAFRPRLNLGSRSATLAHHIE